MAARESRIVVSSAWVTGVAATVWLVLCEAQLGWLPFSEHAWGFNFWAYLPPGLAFGFAGTALALCHPRVRQLLIDGAGSASRLSAGWSWYTRDVIVFVATVSLLWTLRERALIADSSLLFHAALRGWQFVFPDVGATFLMHSVVHADFLPMSPLHRLQLIYCVLGGFMVLITLRVGNLLGGGSVLALLLLTTGVGRIFAGRVETYSVLLCAVMVYMWASLAYLRGRVGWWAPCLALGVSGWLHLSSLFLAPSIALLPRLAHPELPLRAWLGQLGRGALVAALPMVSFALVIAVFGKTADLERAYQVAMEIVAGRETAEGLNKQWWVRVGDRPAEMGIDYVLLSIPHLKYLANASHLLMPFAPWLVLLGALFARPGFRMPIARFLGVAAAPTVLYAFALRPFWGPFDWDLFAITALCVGLLAAHLLATTVARETRAHIATCLIGFQALFVGLPFLAMNVVSLRDAGPFAAGYYARNILEFEPGEPPRGPLAPWL
jgi:hypothetical protein